MNFQVEIMLKIKTYNVKEKNQSFFLPYLCMKCALRNLFLFLTVLLRANPDSGLVAKYTFNNGHAYEEINNLPTQAIGVSYVADRFGNPRSSCFLQGNAYSYLNFGTSELLKPKAASISLWVNIDMIMYGGKGIPVNPIILTKNDTTSDFFESYGLYYNYTVKKIVASTKQSDLNQATIHSSELFSLNKWHHIVLTYDDNYTSLYIDGKFDMKIKKNFPSQFLITDSVIVGTTANAKNQRFLCGSVDDILIYNRVISPKEVSQLFNAEDPNISHYYFTWFVRGLFILVALAITLLLVYRRSKKVLKRQKENNRVNALLNELETRAIRTQMNPHFIFNSLNTLQSFILEEDIANSNLYLTKFALLLRKLIESSESDSISLAEEIDILNRYVEIEKLRFNEAFNYEIVTDIAESSSLFVPFMLVQPFVENAIWHGLLPKNGFSFLSVKFKELDDRRILCVVDDNGVGRKNILPKNSLKKRSLAMEFVKQRLELLEKSTQIPCGYTIIDKKDNQGRSLGTTIEIIIPKLKNNDTRNNN